MAGDDDAGGVPVASHGGEGVGRVCAVELRIAASRIDGHGSVPFERVALPSTETVGDVHVDDEQVGVVLLGKEDGPADDVVSPLGA